MSQRVLPLRMRVLRAERGLTLRQVETETGVAKETLSEIERGERYPQDITLAKLARLYDVPLEELLEDQPHPKASAPPTAPPKEEAGSEERRADLDELHELLTTAEAETRYLALPDEEFERLWEGKTAEERKRLNQELLAERNLVKPLLARWASMPASKERSRLYRLWEHVLVRLLTIAVEKNQEAAQSEAEAARRAGDAARASRVLKEAERFALEAA